ncbi:MAG: nitroreductase [Chlorobi bacterium]|nr:nitroreductase [Chlorobiota bacterium]
MSDKGFLTLALKRQSDREYSDRPVEKEKLLRCLEAARIAPSACNSQPWTFIVVDDPELKNKIADATSNRLLPLNHFTKQAPVHVVIVQEKAKLTSSLGGAIKDKEYPLMDIGIAAEHFCLQAASEGLGTCMLGWFNEKKVKKFLDIPASKRALLIITLGYSKQDTRKKQRKELKDITRHNNYGKVFY